MTSNEKIGNGSAHRKAIYGMAWLIASLITAILSSIANSISNLQSLKSLSVDIPMAAYLNQIFTDLLGLGPVLFVFIAIGTALAFGVAGLLRRWVKPLRWLVYFLAGAACLWVMFMLMERAFFGTPILQGVRTPAGLAAQALCGGLGGYVFAKLTSLKG